MGITSASANAWRPVIMAAAMAVALAGCGSGPGSGSGSGSGSDGAASAPARPTPAARGVAASALRVPAAPPGAPTWAPWPAALHDSRHSGSSTATGPTAGSVRWRRSLEGPVTTGPVVGADGTIYAASNGGVLHALDPSTGSDRWTYDSGVSAGGADLSTSPLVLPDGTVLWGTPGRSLVALSDSGALLWSMTLPGRPTSPASADGRRVYVGDRSGGVSALDLGPGGAHRLAWTVDVGSDSYGSVVTDGSGRLYTTADSSLVAVDDDGESGSVAWRRDPGDGITEVSAGLGPAGTALLGTNGSREWAYRADGGPLWNGQRVITYSSPAVTRTGLAYVADHSGRVQVFDVRRGTVAADYRISPPAQIWSSVAVDRSYRSYFGTQDGRVLGVEPDGSVLFELDVGAPVDSYPALGADGLLLVGTRDGELLAIG